LTVTLPQDTTPPTKLVVTVTAAGPTSIALAWPSTDDGPFIFYNVYQDGVLVLAGTSATSGTAYLLERNSTYTFTVKAPDIRRALEQKDLMARSQDLLDVTKRQSVLIDEARVLRGLRNLPRPDRTESIAKEGPPADPRELFEEMDREVTKGRALLTSLRNAPEA
jgi:hypothetical protein